MPPYAGDDRGGLAKGNEPESPEPGPESPEPESPEPESPEPEPESSEEAIDGLPALAKVRPLQPVAPAALPAARAAAAAATGFLAGAVTMALVKRLGGRKFWYVEPPPAPGSSGGLPVLGSRTYLVHVGVLAEPGE
jgi:hypothetical protein